MGKNNDVLDHFLWKYNCEGKKWGKYGGNMMYVYGLYHGELGEHFLVLTSLNCIKVGLRLILIST